MRTAIGLLIGWLLAALLVLGIDGRLLPFLAELIDVTPGQERWRTAIEAVLGASARLLLVPQERFEARYPHALDTDLAREAKARLSAFKVPNGRNNTWAHPVVVGGKLYIRELDVVYCYDVAAK